MSEQMPTVGLTVFPLTKSFFRQLTVHQLELLKSGNPDEATKALMVDLILDIVQTLSTALLKYLREKDAEVTEERVKSSLGNTVTDSFKAALDVTPRGQTRSAEALRDMISEEVTVSVQGSMSDTPKRHITPPSRLKKMLKLASKMIKGIMCKVRFVLTCRKGEEDSDEATTSDQLPHEEVSSETEAKPEEGKTPEPFWYDTSSSEAKGSYDSGSSSLIFVKPYNGKKTESEPAELEKAESEIGQVKTLEPFSYDMSSSEEEGSEDSGSSIEEDSEDSGSSMEEGSDDSGSPMEIIIVPSVLVPSATPADPAQEEKRKLSLLIMLEKLVSRIYKKMECPITDGTSIVERLMTRTWAAVEGINFEASHKTFAKLDKTLFKDLVKKWGGAFSVLVDMKAGTPALENFIAAAVKAHLVAPPKKRSCICRFFSSVGRAIASICKRCETVD